MKYRGIDPWDLFRAGMLAHAIPPAGREDFLHRITMNGGAEFKEQFTRETLAGLITSVAGRVAPPPPPQPEQAYAVTTRRKANSERTGKRQAETPSRSDRGRQRQQGGRDPHVKGAQSGPA